MFPRYGRRHRRYKVKTPSPKMTYEKKLKIRSLLSLGLLVIFVAVSFFDWIPGHKIKEWLNTTYSYTQWKESFAPVFNSVGNYSKKALAYYGEIFDIGTNGKEREIDHTPKARAKALFPSEMQGPKKQETAEFWRMPHPGNISSAFGERIHPVTGEKNFHNGIDIAANHGDDVLTVHSGSVNKTGYDDANGNFVIISHGEGVSSIYIHLSVISVSLGESLSPGQKIGEVGSTGMSTGPHLHFEIKENGVSVNPQKYIYPDKG